MNGKALNIGRWGRNFEMSKKILWAVPSLVLIICIAYNTFSAHFNINIEAVEFAIFIIGICGINIAAPCFYLYLIYKNSSTRKAIISKVLLSVVCILINATIASPNSIMYYIGLKRREMNDPDWFPMYIVVPFVIIFVGLFAVQAASFINKKRKQ